MRILVRKSRPPETANSTDRSHYRHEHHHNSHNRFFKQFYFARRSRIVYKSGPWCLGVLFVQRYSRAQRTVERELHVCYGGTLYFTLSGRIQRFCTAEYRWWDWHQPGYCDYHETPRLQQCLHINTIGIGHRWQRDVRDKLRIQRPSLLRDMHRLRGSLPVVVGFLVSAKCHYDHTSDHRSFLDFYGSHALYLGIILQ